MEVEKKEKTDGGSLTYLHPLQYFYFLYLFYSLPYNCLNILVSSISLGIFVSFVD